jgi:HTH-type transcriptional regulator, quorum sensing regulator NprR
MIPRGEKVMGVDIGQAIKFNRLRANMTQAELANGIISVSYLSKIENGTAEPPEEIISLLGERLNMNSVDSSNVVTDQSIIRWFHHLLQVNIDESIRLYNKIKNNLINGIDKKLTTLVDIHKLYYFVLIKDFKEAENIISSLHKSSKKFSEVEMYYYLKFLGCYHYSQMEYKKSLNAYQEAEKYIHTDIFHKAEDIHNLYYLIGSAASKIRQTHLSLLYTLRALEYYQGNYDLINCAECHILQGISYLRINDLEKAKESYNYAITIAENIDNQRLLKYCYQNIGTLYSICKDSMNAINYFLKSYELRKNDSVEDRIIPVSSLMKEFFSLRETKKAQEWLYLGLELSKSLAPSDSIYVYEFDVYNFLITGKDVSFEKLIIKHIIPFLEKKELHFEVSFYLEHLANYYKENRKYKLSSRYYEKAYKMLSKILYT